MKVHLHIKLQTAMGPCNFAAHYKVEHKNVDNFLLSHQIFQNTGFTTHYHFNQNSHVKYLPGKQELHSPGSMKGILVLAMETPYGIVRS